MTKLLSSLKEKPYLLADGATGTNYFLMGLKQGDAPELWNLEEPEKVKTLHKAFINAGADIILTNSFGGTRNRLKLHKGLEEKVGELNRRAAELAKEAAEEANKDVIVAGSMGPTGDLYEPIGSLKVEDGVAAYTEQALALAEGGADVLWVETLSSLEELTAAIEGAAPTGLPLVVTASFDSKGRTMMGLSPSDFAQAMRERSLSAFGANCGSGTPDLSAAILEMSRQDEKDILVAKSNAGIPEFKDGDFVYSGTPEHMANYALLVRDLGARIIGGCCGTTPEHLKKMRFALDSTPKGEMPDLEQITALLGEPSVSSQSGRGRRGARRTSRQ